MTTQFLDCTLRDGGYYTNWDFDEDLVSRYLAAMQANGINVIEIGYRNPAHSEYKGEYFYTPVERIQWIRSRFDGKLAILIDVKSVSAASIRPLLDPLRGSVDMIRFAANPTNLQGALDVALVAKSMGFEIAFNVMYFSDWWSNQETLSTLVDFGQHLDVVYLVDSYGAVYPAQVASAVSTLVESKVKVGFHGHNNLELALANTLEAIRAGAILVDSTVTGMGRGAGNLKTELLLTSFFGQKNLPLDFKSLSSLVAEFELLRAEYGWGTSLPYMVAGAKSFPQGKVMDWITTRYYPLEEVVVGLATKLSSKSAKSYPSLTFSNKTRECLVVGGGGSVFHHLRALRKWINSKPNMLLVFASSRHFNLFEATSNDKIVVLVGNESERLERQLDSWNDFQGRCVLPPSPREIPEIVPSALENCVFEVTFNKDDSICQDISSHTAVALQTCLIANPEVVFTCGYDGYVGSHFVGKTKEVHLENESLFLAAKAKSLRCVSLTPTSYNHLEESSIYGLTS